MTVSDLFAVLGILAALIGVGSVVIALHNLFRRSTK